MEIIYLTLIASVSLAGVFVGLFFWANRSNQFDDLDTPAWRALSDNHSSDKKREKIDVQ